MIHDSEKVNELVITESDLNFEKIYNKPYFPKKYEEDLKRANLLLLPYEGFRNFDSPVFPEQTMEFYKFIKDYEGDKLVGEISISDEDYAELELHADLINLADMIVNDAVLPIAIGLITNYLDRKIQGRKTKLKVKVKLTVVDRDKSKSISYEGDADKFEETIKAANQFNN
ncbi:hypothetical protein [Rossellomorea sp. DA94]|uniref:hypothetical protein n=1 Tax=Rossellomorea sp. DA94 TaxID=3038653 RepID=UPI00244B6DE5|nr:hypothetical protein [Rossellomorea sp. DA94]WGG46485.1 hypothetical protein P8596_04450 [Rossellomorea sp. DA94]